MIYLAAVALVLGVLVFVHELGHYMVAKLCGVRVEVFSLGFGKRLWGFRKGDTDYRLSLLPLGGYVKMSGENPMEARTGDPGEFTSHPRWQRFLIAIAGPAMNVILSVVVLTAVYKFHHQYLAVERQPVTVVKVAPGSAAEKAGLRTGDRLVQVGSTKNPNWEQALTEFAINVGQPVDVKVLRDGQLSSMKLTPEVTGSDNRGDVGLIPPDEMTVGTLEPDMPAAKVGIREGDVLLAANGKSLEKLQDLLNLLQQTKDGSVQLTVLRDNREVQFSLSPQLATDGRSPEEKYRIGVSPVAIERLPFGRAFASAYEDCKENSLLIFRLVGKMLQYKVSIRQMSGPIGITIISGQAAKIGFWKLMEIMALISLNLAIFNLLPIPILDGGLMLMLLIEGVMRRDIKQEIKERVYQAAFVFLILFAAVVIYNDLAKALPGHLLLL